MKMAELLSSIAGDVGDSLLTSFKKFLHSKRFYVNPLKNKNGGCSDCKTMAKTDFSQIIAQHELKKKCC